MKTKLFYVILVVAMLTSLMASAAYAAPPADEGQDYFIQKDDWLSKLSDRFLGSIFAWPAIMAATNQAHLEDSSYALIENADLIEVGWKVRIPSTAEGEAFLAEWDPAKPELLFGKPAAGQLVVGSWWTTGGEFAGLKGMFDIYQEQNPGVQIVNAAVAGGAGVNFKGQLLTKLIGGDPPDTFQLHAGLEVELYTPETYLDNLDDLYASEGWEQVFPPDLIQMLKYQDHFWGVPANIHRSNVVWYDKGVFESNGLKPPKTFEEFFAVSEKLKAAGIVPFAIGTNQGWEAGHVFENVLVGTVGAEKYKGLWSGAVPWTDAGVTQALENFKKMMTYANADHSALTWDQAGQLLIEGKGAMLLMGDWTNGDFTAKGYTGYGWVPSPGTEGIFVALSDSFALPKAAPNKDNATAWLRVVGSKAGQEAFNPNKGSICARTDCDPNLFNAYLQSAMQDWASNAIVPSVTHGAAAIQSWAADYANAITLFVSSGDVASTQAAFQQACVDAGACK